MLYNAGAQPFAALIQAAPLRLRLPQEPGTRLDEGAWSSDVPLDERSTARIPACQQAAVEVCRGLPAFSRADSRAQVLVRDVSLRGIRFVYHQQLFPGERVTIWLPDIELVGEVARCLRVETICYEIGTRLDDAIPPKLLKRLLSGPKWKL